MIIYIHIFFGQIVCGSTTIISMFLAFQKRNVKDLLRVPSQGIKNGKPPYVKPFVPEDYGLPNGFVLTNYTKMKG